MAWRKCVEFKVLREEWGEYKLPDGTIARVRTGLQTAWLEEGIPNAQLAKYNRKAAWCAGRWQGDCDRNGYATNQILGSVEEKFDHFTTIRDGFW